MPVRKDLVTPKPLWQHVWDFIGAPFRLLLFDQAWLPRFRWTTLEDERLRAVLPQVRGKLLDVGAGFNNLVKAYDPELGIGVEVHDWGGGAVVVADSSDLPVPDASFHTITFLACLNHIPYRDKALQEANRLLPLGGRVIITMIDPMLGEVGHKLWWYSEDKHRHVEEEERGGMWTKEVVALARRAGFELVLHRRFVYGMNNLYVFKKTAEAGL